MLSSLIQKIFKKNKSSDTAKRRLQFALIYDQMEVSEETLLNLQKEVVEVVSRYFVIDEKSIKLDIQRNKEVSALVVNTPILRAVRCRPGTA